MFAGKTLNCHFQLCEFLVSYTILTLIPSLLPHRGGLMPRLLPRRKFSDFCFGLLEFGFWGCRPWISCSCISCSTGDVISVSFLVCQPLYLPACLSQYHILPLQQGYSLPIIIIRHWMLSSFLTSHQSYLLSVVSKSFQTLLWYWCLLEFSSGNS